MKRNIKHDLSERGFDAASQKKILDNIFGHQTGAIRMEGLVDCGSSSEFYDKLEACKPMWELLEKENPNCQGGFYDWFVKCKSKVVEDSMLRSVRQEAGLGDPPEEFTTNACESINAVVKSKVEYKKSDLPHFLMQMKELIDEQEKEVERAVFKRGKYEFEDDYRHLEVPEAKWFRMTPQQRKKHLQKVATTLPKELSWSETTSVTAVQTVADSCMLSVKLDNVTTQVKKILAAALEGKWKKACELLTSENSIVPAPGHPKEARMVASQTGLRPHLVTKGKDTMYHCDSECANYRSLKICSHTVAVAESNGELAAFVALFTKKAKPPNITKLALHGMPSGRGRKGQQPPRKRVHKEPVESTVPFQPASVTSTQGSTTTSMSTTTFSSSPAMMSGLSSASHNFAAPATLMGMPSTSHFVSPTTFAPFSGPIQFNSPSFAQCFSPSYPMPFTQPTGSPFYVVFISGNISVCAGCHRKYDKPAEAPYDLCIRHEEWREFTTPGNPSLQRRFGNAYYHPSYACIRSRWPYVQSADISVDEIKEHLLPTHQMFLAENLGLYV